MEDYAVSLGGKPVGRAQVSRQGLYYRVVCRCNLSGEVMYRLECACRERKTNLGILVPCESGFGLETCFPVSRVGEGKLTWPGSRMHFWRSRTAKRGPTFRALRRRRTAKKKSSLTFR